MYKPILLIIIVIISIIVVINKPNTYLKNIENFKNKKDKKKDNKKHKKKDKKKRYRKKNNDDWDDYFDDLKEKRSENENLSRSYYGRRRSPISNYNDDNYYDNNDNNNNNDNNRDLYNASDPYGFKKDSDCKSQFTTISFKKILFYMMIFTVISIFIFFISLSGYIAWNEFLKDPMWIKILKTWLAIIFWPAYLTYSFFKSIIFNLNTNKMS
tara:strand:- start:2108 stop:2743 length:636 start_codon:yes stop_codon:yes gene_type:complete